MLHSLAVIGSFTQHVHKAANVMRPCKNIAQLHDCTEAY